MPYKGVHNHAREILTLAASHFGPAMPVEELAFAIANALRMILFVLRERGGSVSEERVRVACLDIINIKGADDSIPEEE